MRENVPEVSERERMSTRLIDALLRSIFGLMAKIGHTIFGGLLRSIFGLMAEFGHTIFEPFENFAIYFRLFGNFWLFHEKAKVLT